MDLIAFALWLYGAAPLTPPWAPYNCTTDSDCEAQCIERGDSDCEY
jgi:hypothetical protein